MPVVLQGLQFVGGCLLLGLGLFLAVGATGQMRHGGNMQIVIVRFVGATSGIVFVAGGLYAAFLALPL